MAYTIKNARLNGGALSFIIDGDKGEPMIFRGNIHKNKLEGTLEKGNGKNTWTGERDPSTRVPIESTVLKAKMER